MSTAVRARRVLPRLRLPRRRERGRRRLPRPGPRFLLVVLALAALLTGAFFWVRQSSLVAVQRVTVTGVSGPDAGAIRQTLVQTAERMTTMVIDSGRLRAAVARYPVVRSLRVSVHLPHSVTIAVFEQVPVAMVDGTIVSSRGDLLRSVSPASQALPTITASAAGAGSGAATVSGTARADVSLLAAAPYPILAKLTTAGWRPGRGLTATLRNGPVIYFGDDTDLVAKWRSAILALASPTSDGASYIDVTDPARPAAGTGSDTRSTESSTDSGADSTVAPTGSETDSTASPPSSAAVTTTAVETTTTTGVTTTN